MSTITGGPAPSLNEGREALEAGRKAFGSSTEAAEAEAWTATWANAGRLEALIALAWAEARAIRARCQEGDESPARFTEAAHRMVLWAEVVDMAAFAHGWAWPYGERMTALVGEVLSGILLEGVLRDPSEAVAALIRRAPDGEARSRVLRQLALRVGGR